MIIRGVGRLRPTTRGNRSNVLGARVIGDWSTHILVSATCFVVVVLLRTNVRVAWVHILVNVTSSRRGRAVVVVRWIVGRIVGRIWCIRKVAIYSSCWWWREVVRLWEIAGVIGMRGRLTWAVATRTVWPAWAVATLTIGGFVVI